MYWQIFKTTNAEPWAYDLPPFFDKDTTDTVTVSIDLRATSKFMTIQKGVRVEIADLSSDEVVVGNYTIQIKLTDGVNPLSYEVRVQVLELPQIGNASPSDSKTVASSNVTSTVAKDPTAEQQEQEKKATQLQEMLNAWRAAILAREKQTQQEKQGRKPPLPRLQIIEQTGLVHVSFDQKMQRLPSLDIITEGKVTIKGKEYPVLKVEVIPGNEDPRDNRRNLAFDWKVTEMTSNAFII